jgi:hypothetical protein
MGARNQVGIELSYRPARGGIFYTFREPRNRFRQSIVCSLAGRYENPTWLLFYFYNLTPSPRRLFQIYSTCPTTSAGGIDSLESNLGLIKSLKSGTLYVLGWRYAQYLYLTTLHKEKVKAFWWIKNHTRNKENINSKRATSSHYPSTYSDMNIYF